jgi:hypothetical protein
VIEFSDNSQLNAMHAAFEAACVELGTDPSDERGRQRIADAIMTVARQGEADVERLKLFAVRLVTDA